MQIYHLFQLKIKSRSCPVIFLKFLVYIHVTMTLIFQIVVFHYIYLINFINCSNVLATYNAAQNLCHGKAEYSLVITN